MTNSPIINSKTIGIVLLVVLVFLVIKHLLKKKAQESGYYPVEYATYPRLTGNDIADIQLLRGYQ